MGRASRKIKGRASRKIKADGDTWSVRVAERSPSDESRVIVFFCTTTDQRPYRVVEVPRERIPTPEMLDELSEDELRRLFTVSRSMDFPRNFHSYSPPTS